MNPIHLLRRFVLLLVGLTLPFEYTVLADVGIKLTPNKLMTVLLVVAVVLQWFVDRRSMPRDVKRPWVVMFGVSILITGMQSIFGGVVPPDLVRRIMTTGFSLILFYFVLSYALKDRRDVDLLLRAFVVGAVLTILSGWLGLGAQAGYEDPTQGGRLVGEGGNPNLLAFNLLITIGGAAALYFSTASRVRRLVYLGGILIMTAGVLATLSRSAYVSLAFMSVVWAVRLRRVGFLKYAVPGLLLATAAALLAPESAVERISTLTPEGIQEDASAHGRLTMFGEAGRAFASNPITGTGIHGYVFWAYAHGDEPSGIHSAFLQVLAESGLLGFIPFVAIWILSWRELSGAWRLARRRGSSADPELRLLEIRALLLQVAFAGVFLMSQAQPSMHHKSLWMMFALSTVLLHLVGVRIAELGPARKEEAPGTWQPPALLPPPLPARPDAGRP